MRTSYGMASQEMKQHGTFQPPRVPQSQTKPGLETNMQPASESTKLEDADGFFEYVGSGKLKDKSVLITGGDSGIGRAVAVLMAREGADVTIAHLPEEQEDAEDTKKMVEAEKRSCFLFAGDLTDHENCRRVVDEHYRSYGSLNILVNNASKQYMCKTLTDIDLNTVESVFRSNILQMFAVTKYALTYMKQGDTIINTTSVVTFRGSASMVDYAATKGAIVGFTRSLATQLIPKGIRVNAVAPGAIYTPIQPDTRPAKQMEGWHSKSPLGRPGQPSEVAPTFVFLASPEASLYCELSAISCYVFS
ncbi:oxidoreductase, short-chain dehydrogenase/reductase family [Talaromyces stipitatus ATCC 10500]|uniref:Oxidoreductase, short-chain dehydrogenase/reductase family n=1 Tax=Talaromyces stipitatus (strain ATCC 10500 / CBS 375.48 / QM 6759 / NRRL 1006) TaxID=441959 RepID=B8M8D7_TALSN|nr:oxidoreductase, short-chain dehydrogenase/reductase family [Talaromyces stipitatus ATCC 10500]EED20450.1 oxidoreductase, short-chain dehydrogenase/reductase family [Talaromyces stipitatus ATCC 10500]